MSLRPSLFALGLAAALLAGCGDPPAPTLEQLLIKLNDRDPRVADAAAELLGDRGRRDPQGIVPVIMERLEQEHLRSRVLAARVVPNLSGVLDPTARVTAVTALGRHVGARVDAAGFPGVQVRQEGETIEVFVAPPADVARTPHFQELLLKVLRDPGGFTVRAEVLPPFAPTPERPVSPWPGDRAEYDAWLAEEHARLDAAASGGPAYVPARAGLRLVPVAPGPEAGPARAIPLLTPQPPLIELDDHQLVVTVGEDRPAGAPALRLVPEGADGPRVGEVLAAWAGLRVWIVMGGEAILPGYVTMPINGILNFPLHGASLDEARERTRTFAARLAIRSFTLPLVVEAIARPTLVSLDSPVARALARVGVAAQPALDDLLTRDKAWEPFVARMREALIQTETGSMR